MSMKIKDLFKKSIDRTIEGVVTIGNEAEERIFQELDEFVVTDEIRKHFRLFFKKYRESINTPTSKIGIWVYGYFGSGKSHFLKMLGYILENKQSRGVYAPDFFKDKIKDQTVIADLEKAASSNTKVIIFNIDSKSAATAKSNPHAIMEVMLSTFNEAVGLCATTPWVADMERELIKEGVYEPFKESFLKYSGKDWKLSGRDQAFLNRNNIIKALVEVRHMDEESARKYFDNQVYNFQTTMTTERFAKTVNEYCKSTDQRVAFMMDEVGQFVGRNTELMLNLQTVVEDLGKYCEGKAWVVVTSQQELKEMLDATADKKLDFSKIQSRFDTRILLSGANADEVIKKRILDKKEDVKPTLDSLFETNETRLSNLIIFDQKPTWNGYKSREDFTNVYPFVSYQFDLLQKVFNAIRDHGMTEGKHLSQNERSLLNAFQEASKTYSDQGLGVLVPFDVFYNTVDNFIDSEIRTVFVSAQGRATLNEFDIRVLKLLFMIKYVKEMPATIGRIATLLVSSINEDKISLKNKIETSLRVLEDETLIQKTSSDTYDFLTNEEQDVNRQINNTAHNEGEILRRIAEMLYEEVLSDQKIRYGKYEFSFNRFVDSHNIGQNNPNNITCIAITGFNGQVSEWDLQMKSGADKLVINLQDGEFLSELIKASKITVFRQNHLASTSQSLAEILQKKSFEHSDRIKKAGDLIRFALKRADIYYNGDKVELGSRDGKERVFNGLKIIVEAKYFSLKKMAYSYDTLNAISDELNNESILFDNWPNEDANKEAYEEIKGKLKTDKQAARITTLKTLTEYFVKAPYGWKELDIKGCIASLWKHSVVSLDLHGKTLTVNNATDKYEFIKGNRSESISIKLLEKIDEETLDKVRRIVRSVFDENIPLNEEKLRKGIIQIIGSKVEVLKNIQVRYEGSKYPAKDRIYDLHRELSSLIRNEDATYIFDQIIAKEGLLENSVEILDEIISFYQQGSSQLKNYNDGQDILRWYEQNAILEDLSPVEDIIGEIGKIISKERPFGEMVQLGELVFKAKKIREELVHNKVKMVKERLEKDISIIRQEAHEAQLKITEQEKSDKLNDTLLELENKYESLIKSLEAARNLDQYMNSSNSNVEGFRHLISSLLRASSAGDVKAKRIELKTLVPVANKKIKTEYDVNKVVEVIRKRLIKELSDFDEIDVD